MGGDSSRAITAHALLLAVALASASTWLGCESIDSIRSMYESAATPPVVLKESNLSLVTGSIPAEPRRSITDADELSLDFQFDPRVVELARVTNFVLWLKDGQFGAWDRTERYAVGGDTRLAGLKDGLYGFRASVVYQSGAEDLVPRGDDRPLVWLTVDRTPPDLRWIFPIGGSSSSGGYCERSSLVVLNWSVEELEFGDQHMIVDWSLDGESWRTAGVVPAVNGVASLRWRIPSVDAESIVLRVSARDFLGHESEARVAIKLFGEVRMPSLVGPTLPKASRPSETGEGEEPTGAADGIGTPVASVLDVEDPATLARAEVPTEVSGSESESESEPGARKKAAKPGSSPSLEFLNLDDEVTFRAGGSRYVFFLAADIDAATPVSLEWSESSPAKWERVGDTVAAAEGKVLWSVPKRTILDGRLRLSATDRAGRRVNAISRHSIHTDVDMPVARIRAIRRDENGGDVAHVTAYDRGPAGLAGVKLFMTRDGGASWSEIGTIDPSAPIALPNTRGNVGLWVSAKDAVGWETPLPQSGDKPQAVFATGANGGLFLEDLEPEFLQGGSEYTLRWRFAGEAAPYVRLVLEISPNSGGDWEFLDEAPINAGRALIILPDRDGSAFVFRGRAQLADGTVLESRSRRCAVDASPPQLDIDSVPERAGAALIFPLRISDPGGSGVDAVFPYVRSAGTGAWEPLPHALLTLKDDTATLSLQRLAEGPWELFITATDVAGNRLPSPTDESTAHGRFTIDRSSPWIRVTPTALPWVEGRDAVVAVAIDREDAIPPLVLQSLGAEARWVDFHRWISFSPTSDLFRFRVPIGRESFSGRFAVRDSVGNLSYAVMEPKAIERALVLRSFNVGDEYVAGRNEPIEWQLHSALEEIAEDLRVAVSYRDRAGLGTESAEKLSWRQVYDGLPVNGTCVWTVPSHGSSGFYELRLRLYLHGDVIGETVTAKPFSIVSVPTHGVSASERGSDDRTALPPPPQPSAKSQRLAERAWSQLRLYSRNASEFQRWSTTVTAHLKRDSRTGAIVDGEWEYVPQETRAQLSRYKYDLAKALDNVEQNFRSAIETDERNAAATYGLSVVLLRHRSGGTREAIKWLRKTIQNQLDHKDALNDLGAALIHQREYGEAAAVLEQAVAAADAPEVRYNLALALFYEGRVAAARPHFRKAMATGSSRLPTGELHYYLIMCLVKEGKRTEARAHFDRFRSAMPKHLQATVSEAL